MHGARTRAPRLVRLRGEGPSGSPEARALTSHPKVGRAWGDGGLWFAALIGLIVGRAGIFGTELYPFGIAYFLAWLPISRLHGAWAGAGVLLGSATVLSAAGLLQTLSVLALAWAVALSGLRLGTGNAGLVGGALVALTGLVGHALGDPAGSPAGIGQMPPLLAGSGNWGLHVAAMAILVATFAWLFGPVQRLLGRWLGILGLGTPAQDAPAGQRSLLARGVRSGRVVAGGLWFLTAVVSGVEMYGPGGIDPARVAAGWAVQVAGLVGGAPVAAAIGSALGVTLAFPGSETPLLVTVLALGGLLAGVFQGWGKAGAASGFLLAAAILSSQWQTDWAVRQALVHAGVSALLLAITPGRWLAALARYLPGAPAAASAEKGRRRHLEEQLAERMRSIASVIEELSRTFEGSGERDGPAAFRAPGEILAAVQRRSCASCPSFAHCWEESLYQSYWDVLEFLSAAGGDQPLTPAGMPARLSARCIAPNRLTEAVNQVSGLWNLGRRWQRQVDEAQRLASGQLKGVAGLVEALASQLLTRAEAELVEEAEWRVNRALERRGLPVEGVTATELSPERLQVAIRTGAACDGRSEAARSRHERIREAVEAALGAQFQVLEAACRPEGPGCGCRLTLMPVPAYSVDVALVRWAKDGGESGGDAFVRVALPDGRLALILSDGMGSGVAAARESEAAVALLERLLKAGFEPRPAVEVVNAALLARGSEESFATVDLVLLDPYSGQVEAVKVGACPSLIRRGRTVESLTVPSLPAGILDQVEVESLTRPMRHGDTLLMFTDGALVQPSGDGPTAGERPVGERTAGERAAGEGTPGTRPESRLAALLRRSEGFSAQETARAIREAIARWQQEAGADRRDDVTVVVATLAARAAGGAGEFYVEEVQEYRVLSANAGL